MTTFPDSRRRAWAASLREFVDHGGETAAWLSSIPGFVALWRVGARGVTGLERAESQRIEPERYLLVAEQSISLSDRARLEATLAADRGTRLLRLRTSTPSRIRERSRLCCREVWDLGLAAELIAGDDALRLEAREYSIGSPQPNAALDLCRSLIELMVRAWPEPFMFRSAVRRGSPAGFPEGLDPQAESKRVLAELCRGMGDAWLILLGRYDIPLPERLRRLLDHFATRPILKSILSWAYGERPLDAELPEDAKTMWFELRALMLDAYANALQQETRHQFNVQELPDHLQVSHRSWLSRIGGIVRPSFATDSDRIDALLLQLIIAKQSATKDDPGQVGRIIRRLGEAGGPALANPCWDSLRSEALCLRRFTRDAEMTQLGAI
jgi:hypothetical protein